MRLRPKTTRRLLILGVVMLVFAGVGAAFWTVNARKSAARIAQARQNAMAAFARGDYAAALPEFSTYLKESKTAEEGPATADVEALLAYGKSRQAIPMPRARHMTEAINVYERYLELRPGDLEAQHRLLDLYPLVKYNEEALNVAEVVLKRDPKDIHALRAKVRALANQRHYLEAHEVAEELAAVQPLDLNAHRWVLEMMLRLQRPAEQIVARFETLRQQHPDDARFELLLATAYHYVHRPDEAARLLKSAAARENIDPKVATELARMLELPEYRMFRESNAVLERLAAAAGDADGLHVRPLVERLWQGGRIREVLKRTEGLDPDSPESDTDLLAYRALALYDDNKPADAAVIVNALAARKDDLAAGSWATAMRARADENLAPLDRIKQYETARAATPDNEVIHFFVGEAYADGLGESEPALRAWEVAARLAPSWAVPAAARARMLAITGRSAEAFEEAREAHQRAPGALSTTTGLIVAWFAHQQQNPDPDGRRKLLDLVTRVQDRFPGERETLHIYVALLSRTGDREKALGVIRKALDGKEPAPRDALLRLAAISFSEKLGLEQEILKFAVEAHGIAPSVAFRQAMLLADGGKPLEGRKLLERSMREDQKADPAVWAVALLQYRENTGDPDVLPEWVRLGEANPANVLVQQAILQSPARLKDKVFWDRTIVRLKKLTGDDAVMPRVERARWLLSGEPSEQDASEAIVLLSDVDRVVTARPEIRRLLGLAYEKNAARKTGSQRDSLLQKAADELEKVFEARNADAAVATDLTRVYRALGRTADAERVMSRVAERAADLGLDGRIKTARTLVAQGQLRLAVGVLEPIGDGQDPTRDAMLCELYRRTGDNQKAASLYRKMADDERADPARLAEGADFFARTGQPAEAERLLAKLRKADLPEGRRALLLARYAEQHGTPEEALAGFEAAVKSDAARPAAWQGLVAFHLRRLKFADAVAAADRGLAAVPNDAGLRSLRTRAAALQGYENDPNVATLADALSDDPNSAAVGEMLRVLAEARKTNEPLAQLVPKLRELADRNPQLLRLQMFVAQGYVRLKDYDEAERVAARAAQLAPNAPEPARLLAAVYAARPGLAKWPKVLDAARQWRQRSMDDPRPADVAIAQTLLEMGQPAEAADQLAPHVTAPLAPDANRGLAGLYARALLAAAREKQAAELLTPLAKTDLAWRKLWLELAAVPGAFGDAEGATKWVEQIAPLLGDAPAERAALAETWVAIGVRFSSDAALAKARATIEPLLSDDEAAPDGWRLLSMVAEASGDMEQAARAYRELLKAQPENSDVQNNLAYALLSLGRKEDLAEARQLAEKAVEKRPTSGTYLDTLARVYRQAGDLPAAQRTFQRALEAGAQGGSVEAMIGLADTHARAGQPAKARDLLGRINSALRRGDMKLSASLQRELDGVRQSVKGAAPSGRLD